MAVAFILDENTLDAYKKFIPYNLAYLTQDKTSVIFGIFFDEPVGIAIIEENEGCYLRYMYILEQYRNIGLGSRAFREIAFCMHFCNQREINVNLAPKHNPQLYSILKEYNPKIEYGETGYLDFSVDEVKKAQRLQLSTQNVIPFKNCLDRELLELKNQFVIKQTNYMPVDFSRSRYDQNLSCVYMENNKAVAVILARKESEGVFVDFMASFAKDILAIIKMMAYGISVIDKLYGGDCRVYAAIANENLTTILEIVLETEIDRQEKLTVDLSFIDQLLIEEL